jgi:hypothetical protein
MVCEVVLYLTRLQYLLAFSEAADMKVIMPFIASAFEGSIDFKAAFATVACTKVAYKLPPTTMSSRYCASPVACSQNLQPDQTQKNKKNTPEKP